MPVLHLIILFIAIFLAVGLLYGAIGRAADRWLKSRGWQTREPDETPDWEAEYIYNLPPGDEWLTLWEACFKQRKLDKESA